MKRKHLIIIGIGIAIWLIETAAFGWNKTPHSYAEARWDGIGVIVILWGIIGDVLTGVRITKSTHEVKTYRINTKRVEFTGNAPVTTKQTINVRPAVKPGTNTLEFKEPHQ